MTDSDLPELKIAAARNIAGSGVVIGIAGSLLLWMAGYVGPITLIILVIVGAIVGGVVFGLPAYLFERKVNRERKQAEIDAAARAAERRKRARAAAGATGSGAAPAGAPLVVLQIGGAGQAPTLVNVPAAYAGTTPVAPGATSASTWSPLSEMKGGPGAPPAPAAPPKPAEPAKPKEPLAWPLDEPLCVVESSREEEIWAAAKALHLEGERVLGFTAASPEEVAEEFGFPAGSIWKISRVEGERNMDPGDLERIGNFIERHFEGGEGRVVVLPAIENLVEAGNVRNVRRLLEVLRDLAQGSKGSMLVSLDPVSLPEAQVTLLERGAHKIDNPSS